MSNDLYNWNLQEGAPFGEDSPLEDLADEVGSWLISENVHFKPAPAQAREEDAVAYERVTLEHWDENDIGTLANALESAIDAYDALRSRLASAQSSAQGEEARKMREDLK